MPVCMFATNKAPRISPSQAAVSQSVVVANSVFREVSEIIKGVMKEGGGEEERNFGPKK